MFPKLRLKLKPNLISLAGGMQQLPCTDPAMRATPLQPAEWREKMAHASAVNAAAADAGGQPGQVGGGGAGGGAAPGVTAGLDGSAGQWGVNCIRRLCQPHTFRTALLGVCAIDQVGGNKGRI